MESLRALRGSDRIRMARFVNALIEDPFQKGDYAETDESGRPIFIKIVGSMAITFWTVHAVKEVKVLDIRPADGIA